ncbi:MAG: ankyrin repeat domain-containing protein [Candidatus Babeliaceae bacterium]|jgi:hypothetical protein
MNNKHILFLTVLFFSITHALRSFDHDNNKKVAKSKITIKTVRHAVAQKLHYYKLSDRALAYAIEHNNISLANLLLGTHKDPNIYFSNGATPLIAAIQKNDTNAVKALIDAGANINMEDEKGDLPLLIALGCLANELWTRAQIRQYVSFHNRASYPGASYNRELPTNLNSSNSKVKEYTKIFRLLLAHPHNNLATKNKSGKSIAEIVSTIKHEEIREIYADVMHKKAYKYAILFMAYPREAGRTPLPPEIIDHIFTEMKPKKPLCFIKED